MCPEHVLTSQCVCDLQAMARDEKNYYQDTPKQIKRKIDEYKRCHPAQYEAFIQSLAASQPAVK